MSYARLGAEDFTYSALLNAGRRKTILIHAARVHGASSLPVTVAILGFRYNRCEAKILQLARLTTHCKPARRSS
jgi:hypothetical protein